MSVCVWVCTHGQVPSEVWSFKSPGTRVTVSCVSPSVGAGNRTQVLSKSSKLCKVQSCFLSSIHPGVMSPLSLPILCFQYINDVLNTNFCFCLCVCLPVKARRGLLDPLELELELFMSLMWELGYRRRSSGRAASNC